MAEAPQVPAPNDAGETAPRPESTSEELVGKISPFLIPAAVLLIFGWNVLQGILGPRAELQVFPQLARVEVTGAVPGEALPEEDAPEPPAAEPPPGETAEGGETLPTPPVSRSLRVTVSGAVLHEWEPVARSAVWVTLIDTAGNSYLVGNASTADDGAFRVEGEVEVLQAESRELAIQAKGGAQGQTQIDELTGSAEILVGERVYRRNVQLSLWAVLGLPAVFFLSLWVAFLQARTGFRRRMKHLAALLLAFAFTASMIYAIGAGLSRVHSQGREDELLSLGYGFLFQGTYVAEGTPEWIFSFTSPRIAAGDEDAGRPLASGFGAPLWVILLSVIGSAVATVSLLVVGTKEPPDYVADTGEALGKFRERIEQIVEHQFFILFAPLGAVFVYQMLVAADAANKPVTVAVAALGAGPVLNYLLAQAINKAKGIIEKGTA